MIGQGQDNADPSMSTVGGDRTGQPEGPTSAGAYPFRYQELLAFASGGQIMTDGKGLVLEASHDAAGVFGHSRAHLIGKPLGLFLAAGHRTRFYESLARLHLGADSDEFETRVGRRDGTRILAVRVTRVPASDGPVASLQWLVQDITVHRRAEAARDELRRRLVTAQEDERRRIARELHDSVAQLLTALSLGIRGVRNAGPLPPPVLERLDDLQRVADELGRQVHDLAGRLRPTALDDLGLEAALGHLVEEWSARTGVPVDFQAVGLGSRRLPPEIETVLYRVVQECLTNVARHARARQVSVVLGSHDGSATAVVEDDGIGFDIARLQGGRLGLIGMYERVILVGGELDVESTPGAGTTVIARIPATQAEERSGHG
jgi:PAS domain S-box-containing protein